MIFVLTGRAKFLTMALGPGAKHPSGTPLAFAYARIMDAMKKHGVKRLIALGTGSITDPKDKFNLQYWALVQAISTFARNAYKDIVAVGETIREKGAKLDLEWTIARVPLLTDHESKEFLTGYIGDGKTNTSLSRAAFAAFVVGEVEKRQWVNKAPIVCSA